MIRTTAHVEFAAVQPHVRLVGLEKSCKMNPPLQNSPSIQPRTNLRKRGSTRTSPRVEKQLWLRCSAGRAPHLNCVLQAFKIGVDTIEYGPRKSLENRTIQKAQRVICSNLSLLFCHFCSNLDYLGCRYNQSRIKREKILNRVVPPLVSIKSSKLWEILENTGNIDEMLQKSASYREIKK